ncbi:MULTISPECIES: hypothetical protein [Citricoccus]|uniref:hypothetical protein n=1 Tax=Citricoccus TaxID=169133 RepID=UPI000255F411|nr:hypothetical protein [Citricoccus sp. CH26A]
MTRASLTGAWPGADPVAAARDILNALGHPHRPVLPELPGRGPGSDPVGRAAVLLDGLAVDLQPHGWRLVPEPGMDHRRAASALRSDVNAFTDVAGDAGLTVEDLVLRVTGPLSLAASLWLPGGERSLSDSGARRDVAQSLASGLADWVRSVRAATGAARLTVLVDEPQAAAVLSGALPTASGYRTVRSIPRSEVRQGWTLVAEAALDGGATGIVHAPGRSGAGEQWDWPDLALLASEALPAVPPPDGPDVPEDPPGQSGAQDREGSGDDAGRGLVLPLAPLEGAGADPARWEVIAGWVEAGRTVTLRLPPPGDPSPAPAPGPAGADRPYRDTAVGIARTWARMGLDPEHLSLVVLGAPDLSAGTRHAANRALAATVAAAEELDRIRQDGGL